jgi:hypothetical protein
MFGKLLSKTLKVVTLPIDAANAAMDMATGGTGTKRSRNDPNNPNPFSLAEELRDNVADAAEDIDG